MRAMWSGAVSFGLVSVPVKAYAATTNHDIRFHQVHAADGGRIKYKRVCSLDGQEVEYADIVKGFETEDGELITLTEEDLDSLPIATGHEIDVVEFVPANQIDPLLFDKSYYLEPDPKAAKPYALLREALVREGFAVPTMHIRDIKAGRQDFGGFLRSHNPRIVIYDISVPYEDNWTFLNMLRQLPDAQERDFIVTTVNKRVLEQRLGPQDVIEIQGGRADDLDPVIDAVKDRLKRQHRWTPTSEPVSNE